MVSYVFSSRWYDFFIISGMLGNIIGGALTLNYSPRIFMGLSALFPSLMCIFGAYNAEKKSLLQASCANISNAASSIFQVLFASPYTVLKPILWVFISNALAFRIGDGMLYFKNSIGLDPKILGFADSLTYISLLLGTVIYIKYLTDIPFRTILFYAQLSKVFSHC